jgi:hypothetical protein
MIWMVIVILIQLLSIEILLRDIRDHLAEIRRRTPYKP